MTVEELKTWINTEIPIISNSDINNRIIKVYLTKENKESLNRDIVETFKNYAMYVDSVDITNSITNGVANFTTIYIPGFSKLLIEESLSDSLELLESKS